MIIFINFDQFAKNFNITKVIEIFKVIKVIKINYASCKTRGTRFNFMNGQHWQNHIRASHLPSRWGEICLDLDYIKTCSIAINLAQYQQCWVLITLSVTLL